MFKKYKWNFVLTVFLVTLIGFGIFDVVLFYSIKDYLFEQISHEAKIKTQLFVALLEQKNLQAFPTNYQDLADLTRQIGKISESRITLIDAAGQVLLDSDVPHDQIQAMNNHMDRPEIKQARDNGWGQSYRTSDTVKRKLFYTAFPLRYDGRIVGYLRLAYYARYLEASMRQVRVLILGASLIGLISITVVSYFLAALVTFPILRIVSISQEIADGNLSKSFPVRRKDEIGVLARILNQLTERLKSQIAQISNERTKVNDILNNLDVGVLVVDQQKNILHCNPQLLEILAVESSRLSQKVIREIIPFDALITAIDQVISTGQRETGEISHYQGNDKNFIGYVIEPFYVADLAQTGALIQLQDNTELRRLEAIRRVFVANASHELKTPLTAIVGYSETLLEGASEDPAYRAKFLRRIREQARRLEYLVTDLLKLSQLEHDNHLELAQVALLPLVTRAAAEFNDLSAQKNLVIQLELPQKSIRVKAEEESLHSVFNNLIDNAVKYTPEGGRITIRVTEVENHRVKVEIIDTGIGIHRKYHERIFQRFYRVDKARSRALGGTGLGLAIVKHILENYGSRIQVASEPGQGSCFWFELEQV